MEYTLASNCTKEELQEIIKGALLNIKDYQEALEIACQLSFEALEDPYSVRVMMEKNQVENVSLFRCARKCLIEEGNKCNVLI